MGRIDKTYLCNFNKMIITIQNGDFAVIAKKIHPERCFDTEYQAMTAMRNHYKNLRNIANENVKKAYLTRAC